MSVTLTPLGSSYPTGEPQVLSGSTGALPITGGLFYITSSGVCAMTLAAPVADGAVLRVIALTAHAHTITTPANGINGADDTATFGATVGNAITLRSFGGQWIMALDEEAGITLSEV